VSDAYPFFLRVNHYAVSKVCNCLIPLLLKARPVVPKTFPVERTGRLLNLIGIPVAPRRIPVIPTRNS
jgi:hypothetical protein